LYILSC